MREHPDWPAYRRALGDRLREARERAGLTQDDLAERADVSRAAVQRAERGHGGAPGLQVVWRLGRAVGVPAHELLRDVP